MLSGDKPFPEPMLTQTYVTIWHHYAAMSWYSVKKHCEITKVLHHDPSGHRQSVIWKEMYNMANVGWTTFMMPYFNPFKDQALHDLQNIWDVHDAFFTYISVHFQHMTLPLGPSQHRVTRPQAGPHLLLKQRARPQLSVGGRRRPPHGLPNLPRGASLFNNN